MPLFKYRAVDPDGNPVDGTMEGPFSHQVVVALQEKGFAVNAVRKIGREKPPVKTAHLSWEDLEQLNYNLLMATQSSLPLAPSLEAMARDLKNSRVKLVLEDIRKHLTTGQSLESALERHPRAFSPVYRALVAAGERTGDLPRVFQVLSEYSKSMTEVKSNIKLAMTYPVVVVVTGMLVLLGLLFNVVPQFAEIFEQFGRALPAPTRLLVDLSDLVRERGLAVLFGLLVLVLIPIAFHLNNRRENRNYKIDWINLHLPVIGRLYLLASVTQFTRALALLLDARVPLLESMELAGATAGNAVVQRRVREAALALNNGAPVSQALQKTRLFDSGACWLIGNAEQSGNLEETLEVLGEEYARAQTHLHRSLTTVAGPAIVIAMGLLVGFVVVSLYLPIFSFGDAITGG